MECRAVALSGKDKHAEGNLYIFNFKDFLQIQCICLYRISHFWMRPWCVPCGIADRSQRCIEMMETVLRSSRYFHAKFSQRDSHGKNLSTTTWALQKLGAVGTLLGGSDTNIFLFSCHVQKRRVM